MDTISDEGWVKLHRKILDNPIFKDSEAFHLFSYLLLKANHKLNRFPFNQQEITLERGQLITGRARISKDTGLSHRQIRTRLALVENLGILTIKTTNRFSIITICNYDYYQDSKIEERPAKRPAKRSANDQQATTNKNDKNEKNNIGRSRKQTDPRVKQFLDYWGEVFLKETGQRYPFAYGKDGHLTKELLKLYPQETLKQVTDAFFKEEWCKQQGFSFGLFKSQFGKLLSKKAMEKPEW